MSVDLSQTTLDGLLGRELVRKSQRAESLRGSMRPPTTGRIKYDPQQLKCVTFYFDRTLMERTIVRLALDVGESVWSECVWDDSVWIDGVTRAWFRGTLANDDQRIRIESPEQTAVRNLESLYTFRSKKGNAEHEIERFIAQHPAVAPVLLEAETALGRIFPGSSYSLEVKRDPDINEDNVVLAIGVDRNTADPRDAVRRLVSLQREWGLGANRRAGGKITVILESR